ncbi:cytochrome b [Pseudidiomarina terrestris]|uniref:cytochrome b n=1 Tax=Pseudidiomarina terrestris TaxID=2820060 RepID=UPI00265623F2|nr:cytochrome b [Pseudidiomarina sp. 1ASP75-5]MDN7136403.1 cytochrome b [Pseudidiomarina sp. 1ASP75-5]
MLRNTSSSYGWLAIAIHWLSAIAVIGLFALGYWMLTLSYYDPWYRLGPWWHKSIGLSLLALTLLRMGWRWMTVRPELIGSRFEKFGARVGHALLYALLLVTMVSGYLISTADGSAISVFDWFDVPAVITTFPEQEEIAGDIHWYAALSLVILAGVHALAAIRHHFWNKDATLKRMLKPQK